MTQWKWLNVYEDSREAVMWVNWDRAKPPAIVPTDVYATDKLTVRAVYGGALPDLGRRLTTDHLQPRNQWRNLPS